ncbi:MAG: sulfite reductase subunit alpha [Opitutaceae bacterium]
MGVIKSARSMSTAVGQSLFTKDNPFLAHLAENRLLNKPGSAKETRHFVIPIDNGALTYTSGDSLGVFPTNDPAHVADVLRLLGACGSENVVLPRTTESITLEEALCSKVSLATPGRKALELMAERAANPAEKAQLTALLAPDAKDSLAMFLHNREHIDLLEEFPSARPSPQEFVEQLRRLVPRLYSIASSPLAFPSEVHLTIAVVRYETNGRQRSGVCSTFLADRVEPGSTPVPVFVAKSHFGPPEDDAVDTIMVGPGTGIAPFRAFLQERAARHATGRNWLFFGDQHRTTDFLYEEEFQHFRTAGVLHRLETAFSRDQAAKVYVQDRMREHGTELWKWLEGGAYFYVCGDARRMAKDVDAALHEIVREHGGFDEVEAAACVKALKQQKRYQRDVY